MYGDGGNQQLLALFNSVMGQGGVSRPGQASVLQGYGSPANLRAAFERSGWVPGAHGVTPELFKGTNAYKGPNQASSYVAKGGNGMPDGGEAGMGVPPPPGVAPPPVGAVPPTPVRSPPPPSVPPPPGSTAGEIPTSGIVPPAPPPAAVRSPPPPAPPPPPGTSTGELGPPPPRNPVTTPPTTPTPSTATPGWVSSPMPSFDPTQLLMALRGATNNGQNRGANSVQSNLAPWLAQAMQTRSGG